jgi:DNA repair protein RecN (Recombination protein N)
MATLLAASDELPQRLKAAEQTQAAAEKKLLDAAQTLSAERQSAAAELCKRLTARLRDLAFDGALITASWKELSREAWTGQTSEQFELLYQPSAHSAARPLAQIASGGELSRVMLALKSELVTDATATLVFDEVDAGIGGAAAIKVAEYLHRLATRHQVIVITHLAQIAAVADCQYVVNKELRDGFATTTIALVEGEERVAEIARMLSGKQDELTLQHARKLLAEAKA